MEGYHPSGTPVSRSQAGHEADSRLVYEMAEVWSYVEESRILGPTKYARKEWNGEDRGPSISVCLLSVGVEKNTHALRQALQKEMGDAAASPFPFPTSSS